MPLSRRQLLFRTLACSLIARRSFSKQRPARKDSYFGLHFDLHPNANDSVLGRDLTESMVSQLLNACRPDFVQYDSKGHAGYLGFPSPTGMSAPGIVQDSLAIWRRVTAREGVALYNHFSGVLDGLAVARHPDWARIAADGKSDGQETSLAGPYEAQLMIPELIEAALRYDLDGSWVDGDCWAVTPDYSPWAARAFQQQTGHEVLPKTPADPGWHEFLEWHRRQFRDYVTRYVIALHRAKPGFQITSNWMYSTFVPERPAVPLDFLSGDVADQAPIPQARLQARYLASTGMAWDLMSWGFETHKHGALVAHKPAAALQRECAIVLAQGGGYQIYYQPSRAGWIDDRIVHTAAKVAAFCRDRQSSCAGSASIPEVGVLYSGHSLYRTADRVFGPWGAAESPALGALGLLLACGFSVDIIPDWRAAELLQRYPLVVLPDWPDVGSEIAGSLVTYLANGGKLLVFGAATTRLLAPHLNLDLVGPSANRSFYVADDSGLCQIEGMWQELAVGPNLQVLQAAYRGEDTRQDTLPLSVRVSHGRGSAIVCPAPFTSAYATSQSAILISLARKTAHDLHRPLAEVQRLPGVEIVLRTKGRDMLVHLINADCAGITDANSPGAGLSNTRAVWLRVRLPAVPRQVFLDPGGIPLKGTFTDGEWHGTAPAPDHHSVIRFVSL